MAVSSSSRKMKTEKAVQAKGTLGEDLVRETRGSPEFFDVDLSEKRSPRMAVEVARVETGGGQSEHCRSHEQAAAR